MTGLYITIAGMLILVAFQNQWQKWRNAYSCVMCGTRRPDKHGKNCPNRRS